MISLCREAFRKNRGLETRIETSLSQNVIYEDTLSSYAEQVPSRGLWSSTGYPLAEEKLCAKHLIERRDRLQ